MTETAKDLIQAEDPFVLMVERLATNKDIDADKLQKIVDIQIQIMDREAEAEFSAAMSRVQAKLPIIEKTAYNEQTRSKYAKHEAIAIALKPVYTAEGFSATFSEGKADVEGDIRIKGVLRHAGGHSEEYFVHLPRDDSGIKGTINKTPLHAKGSTFTYGRRYLTCLMFDVATGDDTDGNLPDALVTPDQADQLQALYEKLPTDRQAKFLKWALGRRELGGEETVDDIKAKLFDVCLRKLQKATAE